MWIASRDAINQMSRVVSSIPRTRAWTRVKLQEKGEIKKKTNFNSNERITLL